MDAVNADKGILGAHELELVVDGSDGSDAVASYLRLQNDKTKLMAGKDSLLWYFRYHTDTMSLFIWFNFSFHRIVFVKLSLNIVLFGKKVSSFNVW